MAVASSSYLIIPPYWRRGSRKGRTNGRMDGRSVGCSVGRSTGRRAYFSSSSSAFLCGVNLEAEISADRSLGPTGRANRKNRQNRHVGCSLRFTAAVTSTSAEIRDQTQRNRSVILVKSRMARSLDSPADRSGNVLIKLHLTIQERSIR